MIIWIPILIITSILSAYFSFQANESKEWKWVAFIWSLNLLPLWSIVSRYSKDLLFDGVIYDIILTVAYTATIMYLLNKNINFNWIQIICIVIIVLALIVFKISKEI